jgi:hypothetical protein
MNREQILDLCYSAQTLSEIEAAREARCLYLHQCADDQEILELGEMLLMIEDALKIVELVPAHRLEPTMA